MKESLKEKTHCWSDILLENIGRAIITTDLRGRINFVNGQASRLLGGFACELEGVFLNDALSRTAESGIKGMQIPWTKILYGGQIFWEEKGHLLIDGNGCIKNVSYSASPIIHQGVLQGIIVVIALHNGIPRDELAELKGKGRSCTLPNSFFVKKEGSLVKIQVDDVHWIEAMENYAILNTSKEKNVVHATLKSLIDQLAPKGFVRVHRSFIVSLAKIDRIEDNRLYINEQSIPIGKSFRADLMKKLCFI